MSGSLHAFLAAICSSLSTPAGDARNVCTHLWPSCHHHLQPPHPHPHDITPFIGTKQQPVPPTLHHCSAPAADAQLRFSRGALTSPSPPSQSSALFILSNTYCLARGGHVGCFAGTCHVSAVIHNPCNEELRHFNRRKISKNINKFEGFLQRREESPLKMAADVEITSFHTDSECAGLCFGGSSAGTF